MAETVITKITDISNGSLKQVIFNASSIGKWYYSDDISCRAHWTSNSTDYSVKIYFGTGLYVKDTYKTIINNKVYPVYKCDLYLYLSRDAMSVVSNMPIMRLMPVHSTSSDRVISGMSSSDGTWTEVKRFPLLYSSIIFLSGEYFKVQDLPKTAGGPSNGVVAYAKSIEIIPTSTSTGTTAYVYSATRVYNKLDESSSSYSLLGGIYNPRFKITLSSEERILEFLGDGTASEKSIRSYFHDKIKVPTWTSSPLPNTGEYTVSVTFNYKGKGATKIKDFKGISNFAYTFNYWITSETTGDTMLYANSDYTVTNMSSSSLYVSNYNTNTTYNDITLTKSDLVSDYQKTIGYTQIGFAKTIDDQPFESYNIKNNTTIYAVWKGIEYSIDLDLNSKDINWLPESFSGERSYVKTFGDSSNVTAITSTKPQYKGFIFKGWSPSKEYVEGTSKLFLEGSLCDDIYKGVNNEDNNNKSITLYAVWEPINYVVNYKYYNKDGVLKTNKRTFNCLQYKTYPIKETLDTTTIMGEDFVVLGWINNDTKTTYATNYDVLKGIYIDAIAGKELIDKTPLNKSLDVRTVIEASPYLVSTFDYYAIWTASGKFVKLNNAWNKIEAAYIKINGKWRFIESFYIKKNNKWVIESGHKDE